MATPAMSIILYTALQTMQPCEKVFADTAMASNPNFRMEEKALLDDFAKEACATSFPDILWLLALQETNFRFVIVRENFGKDFRITQGSEAIQTLKALKEKSAGPNPPSHNVDIGVMQFNWRWHGENFGKDPMLALSPKRQVKYFIEKYSRYIYQVCDQSWVGCYHNQANVTLSSKYQNDIKKKTVVLVSHTLRYLKENRQKLTGEQLDKLPPVKLADLRKNFAYVRTFPKPERKTIGNLILEIAMRTSQQGSGARTVTTRE